MPYTLTMTVLWMALAAGLGAVAGYLFRGRTPAQRARSRRGAVAGVPDHERETREVDRLRAELARVDQLAGPLAEEAATVPHPRWGAIMRAGIDKSHIARQIERKLRTGEWLDSQSG